MLRTVAPFRGFRVCRPEGRQAVARGANPWPFAVPRDPGKRFTDARTG